MKERFYPGTDHQKACYEQIKDKLFSPKAPGPWWKEQVRRKYEEGGNVTPAALDLANRGLDG